jgi:hypothetical protein
MAKDKVIIPLAEKYNGSDVFTINGRKHYAKGTERILTPIPMTSVELRAACRMDYTNATGKEVFKQSGEAQFLEETGENGVVVGIHAVVQAGEDKSAKRWLVQWHPNSDGTMFPKFKVRLNATTMKAFVAAASVK